MPFNFYDTHTLLMAVQQLIPATTFLRDRYFPTNDSTDIFATEDVLVEYRDGTRKLAPFVAPRKGGVTILRKGYTMERYTPPFVAPRRTLTLDELRKRGFGEALYSQLTPEQRQQVLIMRDADELGDLITNREEAMAAETMLTNGCIMKHIADDADKSDEMEIRFYSEGANPATGCFFVFFASMAVAGLFELGEYVTSPIIGRDLQNVHGTGVGDTMGDMFVCLLGTLVVNFLMIRNIRGKHDPFTDAVRVFAAQNTPPEQSNV